MGLVPIVIEKTPRGERAYDIFSRLLKERIVILGNAIDDEVATSITSQLLFWNLRIPIRIFICISTVQEVLSLQVLPSMTQCSI